MGLFLSASLSLLSLSVLQVIFNRLYKHYTLSAISSKHGCAHPSTLPSHDPIFGIDTVIANFKSIKNHCRMHTTQARLRDHGHTFQHFAFGKRSITTIDPSNIQAVLSLQHEKFGVGPVRGPAVAMLGPGIVVNDGNVWENARAMIRPAFTRSQIADRQMFEKHVERFLELVPRDGRMVDLQPLFDKLILDASSEFIFGESFDSLLPSSPIDSEKFMDAFNKAQKGVGMRIVLGKLKFFLFRDRFGESTALIRAYTRRHVDRVLERQKLHNEDENRDSSRTSILVYELAKETGDREELTSQLLNVFFAGRDTPAVALTNTFFLLARHPEVWKKCQEEVKGLNKEDLSFEKLKSLRYIQHVINEAMRLLPPVAQLSRSCLTSTTLPTGGSPSHTSPIFVAKGDTIILPFFSLHRSPIFGPDPETFRPERWQHIRPTWEYLPFGGGARHCPAQQLALFWVGYTLVRMMLELGDIRNEDAEMGFREEMKLNMESGNGAKVSFGRRVE